MKDETFTIQFYTQESRKEFFDKYGQSITKDGDRSQFFLKAMGVGNIFNQRDNFHKALVAVWDAFQLYNESPKCPNKNKLLDIICEMVETGCADNEFFEKFGGKQELDRLMEVVR